MQLTNKILDEDIKNELDPRVRIIMHVRVIIRELESFFIKLALLLLGNDISEFVFELI